MKLRDSSWDSLCETRACKEGNRAGMPRMIPAEIDRAPRAVKDVNGIVEEVGPVSWSRIRDSSRARWSYYPDTRIEPLVGNRANYPASDLTRPCSGSWVERRLPV